MWTNIIRIMIGISRLFFWLLAEGRIKLYWGPHAALKQWVEHPWPILLCMHSFTTQPLIKANSIIWLTYISWKPHEILLKRRWNCDWSSKSRLNFHLPMTCTLSYTGGGSRHLNIIFWNSLILHFGSISFVFFPIFFIYFPLLLLIYEKNKKQFLSQPLNKSFVQVVRRSSFAFSLRVLFFCFFLTASSDI